MITIETDDFVTLLQTVGKAVPGKATRDALLCVRLHAAARQLRLGAMTTNLEVRLESSAALLNSSDREWSAVVPHRPLLEFLSKCSGKQVKLEIGAGKLLLSTNELETYSIHLTPVDEFPEFEGFRVDPEAAEVVVHFNPSSFRGALDTTRGFAAKPGATRYAMDSVQLSIDRQASRVSLVATDGRRLCVTQADGEVLRHPEGSKGLSWLLPVGACALLSALLPKKAPRGLVGSPLMVYRDGKRCSILHGATWLHFDSQEGDFPKYAAVMRARNTSAHSITVVTKPLRSKLATVATVATTDARAVRFTFGDRDSFQLHARSAAKGSASAPVPLADEWRGGEQDFALNPDFMEATLAALGAKEVEIDWNDRTSPVQVHAGPYTAVIMPITVDV
jgi:DNA polymerase III sliding clamp (beta) subunit (PCNA family)